MPTVDKHELVTGGGVVEPVLEEHAATPIPTAARVSQMNVRTMGHIVPTQSGTTPNVGPFIQFSCDAAPHRT